jgi:hypothetical protein
MATTDEFRQSGEEAMHWACQAKTEKDKATLLDLARIWTQTASYRETAVVASHGPPRDPGAVSRV